MPERISTAYRRLFEVRLLHHYWLDEGRTLFDALTAEQQEKRLLAYDIRPVLTVGPTDATDAQIRALGGVFRQTPQGFLVAVPANRAIPDDTLLTFWVAAQQADFFGYTALTLQPRPIVTCFQPTEKQVYRYKQDVPVLSNLTGVSRGSGAGKKLFLSKEIPLLSASDKVEAIVNQGGALSQLTSDQPGAALQQIGAQLNNLPIFVHQGDTEAIVPPAALEGTPPPRGILLADGLPDNVVAVVRIGAVRGGSPDYSCTQGGFAKAAFPIFQVRFKNRSTVWKYFNKNTQTPTTTEPNPLPLTYFGNSGTKLKPPIGQVKPEKVANRVVQLVSEIFE